jgi:hypothetical protein
MNPTAWERAAYAAKAFNERLQVRPIKPWERIEPPRRRDTKKGHR